MSEIRLYNADCMAAMAKMPDKAFDLAIVDPPYGIGFDREIESMVKNNTSGKWKQARGKGYERKEWDSAVPDDKCFDELFRVSKRQIVWGGNYFNLPLSGGWIVWDKQKPEGFSLSQAELAWCSSTNSIKIFKWLWHGFQKQRPEERIHPTQKPVALYKWLLKNYAKPGDTILDTHLGSASSAIAAYDMGFDFTGYEIDKDYFDAGVKRFEQHKQQLQLFQP